ncbi:MAG: MBL fold metallo-hydrolase [Thermoplasmata archaeon]|nr:MAG: MBL fold metallo-hydrolase [Thermoplasmata archaeon]
MEIYQIGGQFYDSNIYLIKSKRSIIIDTGTGSRHERVIKNLEAYINPKDIDTIILTHRHFDHTGGAESMKRALDAEIIIHESASEALRSGDEVTTAALAFGKSFPKLDVSAIKEGDIIDCGDMHLKVLHTPGHSICSIVLYDSETKTLFSGDTVYTDGGIGRWDLPTGNYKELVASLKRLTEMDVDTLYPGHGPSAKGDGNRHIALGLKSARLWG